MKFFYLNVLCVLFSNFLIGQSITISGKVVDLENRPIIFTNIGIKNKNVGTVCDEEGNFIISIPLKNQMDDLTFSHIGYKEINFPIQELKNNKAIIIKLEVENIDLQTVIVSNRKPVIRKIGIKSRSPFIYGNPVDNKSGDINEFFQKIRLDNKPSQILNANIYVIPVESDNLICRINFYAVENNLPGHRLYNKEVLQKREIKKGWLNFDLSDSNIVFKQDFFVGFEFISDKSNRSFIYGARLGGRALVRESSLGKFEDTPGVSLSAYVTVKQ